MPHAWSRVLPVLGAAGLLAAGCLHEGGSGDSGADRTRTTVAFLYVAPTALDPAVAANYPDCVALVGQTHIHPSWALFNRFDMNAVGADPWEQEFTDVPTTGRMRIRINDPNECANHPTGAVTHDIYANGVLLTTVVDTPGDGVEPGLSFEVDADGNVTP